MVQIRTAIIVRRSSGGLPVLSSDYCTNFFTLSSDFSLFEGVIGSQTIVCFFMLEFWPII